jgi:hypothetical protein
MTRSTRLALATFALGFVVEAGTEAYQFFAHGYRTQAWPGFYYVGLGTTVAGFYLIYRGRGEWTDSHRRLVKHGHRAAWAALALFAVATVLIVVAGLAFGTHSGAPLWLEALVGGAVAVAFGNFFLGLLLIVYRLVGPLGRALALAAFVWSLGVALLTGWIVGQEYVSLLQQFVSDPLTLVASFAPLAFAMAPLFVTYFLLTGAYLDALHRIRERRSSISKATDSRLGRDRSELPPGAGHR